MPTRTTDDQATHTFRAATLEEAVAIAERTLGRRVTLVAANRIRRGGLGGFFAADLGVEVVVSPIEETVESALERLISTTSNNDKARWEADRTDPAAAIAAALSAVVAGDSAPVESPGRTWLRRRTAADDLPTETNSWYSPPTSDHDRGNRPERLARMAELDRMFAASAADERNGGGDHVDSDPTGRLELSPLVWATDDPAPLPAEATPSAVAPVALTAPVETLEARPSVAGWPRAAAPAGAGSPGLARVERIIEELQVLTSTPRLMAAMRTQAERPGEASATSERVVAPSEPETTAPVGSRPAPGMVMRPSWPTATRSTEAPVAAPTEVEAPASVVSLAIPRALAVEPVAPAPARIEVPAPSSASSASSTTSGPSELSQRQVELAVSAADALMGSLRREDGVKRLSVRVVLRTGDHEEVAAEAEWDAGE
jgi:hypothetical protein